MPQVVIESPVINSPFDEPKRHLRLTEDGITEEAADNWSGKGCHGQETLDSRRNNHGGCGR